MSITGTRRVAVTLAVALSVVTVGCQSVRPQPSPVPAPSPIVPPPAAKPAPAPRILFLPRPAALPKSCLAKSLGAPPRYPDSDAALRAAAGAADRYQLLAAGRILRQQRLDELERAIAGCR